MYQQPSTEPHRGSAHLAAVLERIIIAGNTAIISLARTGTQRSFVPRIYGGEVEDDMSMSTLHGEQNRSTNNGVSFVNS